MASRTKELPAELQALDFSTLDSEIEEISKRNWAENTKRAYTTQWENVDRWTVFHGIPSQPAYPQDIARYLAALRKVGKSRATCELARAAIAADHRDLGYTKFNNPAYSPNVREVLKGMRRSSAAQRQAKPLTAAAVAAIVRTAMDRRVFDSGVVEPADVAQIRGPLDIAIVLVLSSGGLRRSEAAALTWADVQRWRDGTGRLTIGRSKLNQEGDPQPVAVSKAAMDALDAIRPEAGRPGDKVFNLKGRAISNRVQAAAKHAGLGDGYSGHSGRVGMAMTMTENGAPVHTTMRQGRWNSAESVARYSRNEEASAATQWLD